ncbi:dc12-related [Anaeramoeba flamelloides]|uniref:Dc12-related n=1 Tax=Anaeramoeba flamelloides TaxID=1746091 RepID=A0AAV7YDR9_9EUKA|nr:dc12-related [Anaeramoeba flamelloides]
MCGRGANTFSPEQLQRIFDITNMGNNTRNQSGGSGGTTHQNENTSTQIDQLNLQSVTDNDERYVPEYVCSYNLGATNILASIHDSATNGTSKETSNIVRTFQPLKWGISPVWNKKMTIINSRSETFRQKSIFSRMKRCVIIFSGYYEWKKKGKTRTPYYHTYHNESEPIVVAGLWSQRMKEGKPVDFPRCVILTTKPNQQTKSIHNRMPAILDKNMIDTWICSGYKHYEVAKLCRPYSGKLKITKVSQYVNSIAHKDKKCIKKDVSEESLMDKYLKPQKTKFVSGIKREFNRSQEDEDPFFSLKKTKTMKIKTSPKRIKPLKKEKRRKK